MPQRQVTNGDTYADITGDTYADTPHYPNGDTSDGRYCDNLEFL